MTPNRNVTILDYGLGNIFSVSRAFEAAGATVTLTSDPAKITQAGRLILPGVGAFANGMKGLRELELIGPIREFAKTGNPFLGICLGMQMMLDSSQEFGTHEGLGLVSGEVRLISNLTDQGDALKVPHIGWSELHAPQGGHEWKGTPLTDVAPGKSVYFVHSYSARLKDPKDLLAQSLYGGHPVAAAIASGSLYGCQFHPERSGPVGLQIIRSFIEL